MTASIHTTISDTLSDIFSTLDSIVLPTLPKDYKYTTPTKPNKQYTQLLNDDIMGLVGNFVEDNREKYRTRVKHNCWARSLGPWVVVNNQFKSIAKELQCLNRKFTPTKIKRRFRELIVNNRRLSYPYGRSQCWGIQRVCMSDQGEAILYGTYDCGTIQDFIIEYEALFSEYNAKIVKYNELRPTMCPGKQEISTNSYYTDKKVWAELYSLRGEIGHIQIKKKEIMWGGWL